MSDAFPKLYAIADRQTLDRRGIRVSCFAGEMARAGEPKGEDKRDRVE